MAVGSINNHLHPRLRYLRPVTGFSFQVIIKLAWVDLRKAGFGQHVLAG